MDNESSGSRPQDQQSRSVRDTLNQTVCVLQGLVSTLHSGGSGNHGSASGVRVSGNHESGNCGNESAESHGSARAPAGRGRGQAFDIFC